MRLDETMIDKFIDYLYTSTETGTIFVLVCGGIGVFCYLISKIIKYGKIAYQKIYAYVEKRVKKKEAQEKALQNQQEVQHEIKEILQDLVEFRQEIQEVKSSIETFNNESVYTQDYRKKNDCRLKNLEDQYERINESIKETNDSVRQMSVSVNQKISEISSDVQGINQVVPSLINSDIESFKTYLIDTYTTARREKSINVYTLKTLINRFKIYQNEGGNSWAEAIVNKCAEMPVSTFTSDDEAENAEFASELADFNSSLAKHNRDKRRTEAFDKQLRALEHNSAYSQDGTDVEK